MTVWLCHIPHSYALLRRRIAPSSMVCPSVFLSLCQCVTLVSPAKNGWNDQVTICVPDSGGPNEQRIRSRCQYAKGQFWGGNRQTIANYRDTPLSSVKRRLNRSRCRLGCGLAWAVSNTCYMGGPDPHEKGQFWWTGAPFVKYRHFLP